MSKLAEKKDSIKLKAIEEAGKKPSGLTKRTVETHKKEAIAALKKFGLGTVKKNLIGDWENKYSLVTGSSLVKNVAYTVFGVKATKILVKDSLSRLSPLYKKDGEDSVSEYYKKYYGGIYNDLTGNCIDW